MFYDPIKTLLPISFSDTEIKDRAHGTFLPRFFDNILYSFISKRVAVLNENKTKYVLLFMFYGCKKYIYASLNLV